MGIFSSFAQDYSIKFSSNVTGTVVDYYIRESNLPGINLDTIDLYTTTGERGYMNGNSILYNELNVSIFIDEEYRVWRELVKAMQADIRVTDLVTEAKTGITTVTNSKYKDILTIKYEGLRIETIGDVQGASTSDGEELFVDVTFKYDKFTIIE